ncbi:hypothetical protein OAS39_03850 [Pirellulales bacterium]|nr:hypothetical protein [Pirellulales bacterium]
MSIPRNSTISTRTSANRRTLYAEHPDKVRELTQLMEKLVTDGRSTPGAAQENDHPVHWNRFTKN